MTDHSPHEFLEEAFHGLRDEVTRRAPSFGDVLDKPRAHPPRAMLPAWLPFAAVLTLMVGGSTWFLTRDSYPRLPEAYNVISWEAPTDFLLENGLRRFLHSVPAIGRTRFPDYSAPEDPAPNSKDSSTDGRIQL